MFMEYFGISVDGIVSAETDPCYRRSRWFSSCPPVPPCEECMSRCVYCMPPMRRGSTLRKLHVERYLLHASYEAKDDPVENACRVLGVRT